MYIFFPSVGRNNGDTSIPTQGQEDVGSRKGFFINEGSIASCMRGPRHPMQLQGCPPRTLARPPSRCRAER